MSQVELFVRHEAEIDALAYFDYIRHRNPDAALRFLAAIDSTVEALSKQPLMGRLRRFRGKDLANIRSWRINGFQTYLIFYRFEAGRLEILRVKHGAMKFPRALRRN